MRPKTSRLYLHDALLACAEIEEYTHGRTLEEYLADRRFQLTIERLFEIIGEAMNRALHLSPSLESRISHLHDIIGFRNRLIHAYDRVDNDIVWTAVSRFVPILRSEVERILGSTEPV